MKITIIGRKVTVRNSFKERVEKKLSKIERFFGDDAQAKVTVTVEKNFQTVEITVVNNGIIFRAEESADKMNDALDRCVDLLVRQIRKNKTRIEKKLKTGAFDDFVVDEHITEEIDFDIVRTKLVSLKPQSIDEAILQMNMLGHRFYMFLNEATDSVTVVYSRNDGGYGLLEPEAE